MPLTRPALTLGPGPRAVHQARRWVVDLCHDLGRPELIDCAEMGVSELVTNALLHGEPPIELRFRGTLEHPRVEVRDHSTERPVLPHEAAPGSLPAMGDGSAGDDDEDLLLTFGRGLSIVARSADAWGAEIESDGKIVWFAPAAEFSEDHETDGVISGVTPEPAPRRPRRPDDLHVVILGVPLRAYNRFERHLRELRREVRLLSLAHEEEYPLAKDLSDLFGTLERELRDILGGEQISAGRASGADAVDIRVTIARSSLGPVEQLRGLLDLADDFCREERMLALARTPDQRDFQEWFLGEAGRQGRGEPPLSWGDTAHSAVS